MLLQRLMYQIQVSCERIWVLANDKRWHQRQAEWEPELDRIVADIDRCFWPELCRDGVCGRGQAHKGRRLPEVGCAGPATPRWPTFFA